MMRYFDFQAYGEEHSAASNFISVADQSQLLRDSSPGMYDKDMESEFLATLARLPDGPDYPPSVLLDIPFSDDTESPASIHLAQLEVVSANVPFHAAEYSYPSPSHPSRASSTETTVSNKPESLQACDPSSSRTRHKTKTPRYSPYPSPVPYPTPATTPASSIDTPTHSTRASSSAQYVAARNKQVLSGRAPDVRAIYPPHVKGPFPCPVPGCSYVKKQRKDSDLQRHVNSHYRDAEGDERRIVCCGVRLERAAEFGVTDFSHRLERNGEVWVGGCDTGFSRPDALRRHLRATGCPTELSVKKDDPKHKSGSAHATRGRRKRATVSLCDSFVGRVHFDLDPCSALDGSLRRLQC